MGAKVIFGSGSMVIEMGLPVQKGACFTCSVEFVEALVRNITKQNIRNSFIRY
jgi:hypothetical protein